MSREELSIKETFLPVKGQIQVDGDKISAPVYFVTEATGKNNQNSLYGRYAVARWTGGYGDGHSVTITNSVYRFVQTDCYREFDRPITEKDYAELYEHAVTKQGIPVDMTAEPRKAREVFGYLLEQRSKIREQQELVPEEREAGKKAVLFRPVMGTQEYDKTTDTYSAKMMYASLEDGIPPRMHMQEVVVSMKGETIDVQPYPNPTMKVDKETSLQSVKDFRDRANYMFDELIQQGMTFDFVGKSIPRSYISSYVSERKNVMKEREETKERQTELDNKILRSSKERGSRSK